MEVYILDDQFRRTTVVGNFESMVWSERYSSEGDFELVVHSTLKTRNLFTIDAKIAINESYRVMIVRTVTDAADTEGRSLLTIKGPSIEHILTDRIARQAVADLTTTPTWDITDAPASIAREIFRSICIAGDLDAGDVVPYYVAGNLFPADTIAEPMDSITQNIKPATVYKAIKDLCDIYDLGFRLYRGLDTSKLYFNIYTGNDRTTQQKVLPPVVFSPNLDNLAAVTKLTSAAKLKNVVYVFSKNGAAVVYATGVDSSVSGFNRRSMLVSSDNDDVAGTSLTTALELEGKEALTKNKSLSAFDGEIQENSSYKYGTDYQLGDLVEMRDSDGLTNNMRVTEQIFVSDAQGERSYPTLTIDLFITPGSWLAWDFNNTWALAVGTWAEA